MGRQTSDRHAGVCIAVAVLRWLEGFNIKIGNVVCWLALGCALFCFLVVILRYAFGIGVIWMQELYVWQHALLFILGSGPALTHDKHIRVDLITESRSDKTRAALELLGICFLLFPFIAFIALTAWPFVLTSWATGETTGQSGGLSGVYLLKGSLLIFVLLLGLQGIVGLIRNTLVLSGHSNSTARPT
ncbi:TRAP transporter small permease subunit [Notoacmeibacter marinus]|nr:TRAP transporter small permease subunit [Notoacmeibacter marinus]